MSLSLAGGGDVRNTVLHLLRQDDGTSSSRPLTLSTFQDRLRYRATFWRNQHQGLPPPPEWQFPLHLPPSKRDKNTSFTFDRLIFECDQAYRGLETTLIPWVKLVGKTRALLYTAGLNWISITAHILDPVNIHISIIRHQKIYNSLRGLGVLVERPLGRLMRPSRLGEPYSIAYITESIPRLPEVEIIRICKDVVEPGVTPLPDGPFVFTFRACLGRLRPSDDKYSGSCHDRPLFFDTLQRLYPQAIYRWATELGRALANLHWAATVDAREVNVVLGNARLDLGEQPSCSLWLTDVDRCHTLQVLPNINLRTMAAAVICNPCWPLPPDMPCFNSATERQRNCLTHTWNIFSGAYLAQSEKLMQIRVSGYDCHEKSYPIQFINYMNERGVDPLATLQVSLLAAPFDPQNPRADHQFDNYDHLYHEEGVTIRTASTSSELSDDSDVMIDTAGTSPLPSWAILEAYEEFVQPG